MFDFPSRRVALVTGATSGLGLATVRQLAAHRLHVILASPEFSRALATTRVLQAEQLSVEAVELDATDEASIVRVVADVSRRFGRLDVLINNADVCVDDPKLPPSEQALKVWQATFAGNLFGVVNVTRLFLELLRAAPAARVVNVSSLKEPCSAVDGTAALTFKKPAHEASKSALNSWTMHLARELRATAIKVNTIHFGLVRTEKHAQGEIDVDNGARASVRLALLDEDGPTGGFHHLEEPLRW